MNKVITMHLNGRSVDVAVAAHHTLLEVLRDQLGLRGTVEGCGVGVCGSCTVLVDERPVSSCLMLASNAADRRIVTIEGMASPDGALSRVQRAFLEEQAFQCGFCTPGMIMAVEGLLREHPSPGEAETRDYLSGNLCRCGTYSAVLAAVRAARQGPPPNPSSAMAEDACPVDVSGGSSAPMDRLGEGGGGR